MALDHNDPDQISMENGDEWYFDQFGEYRNAMPLSDSQDSQTEELAPDELGETPDSTAAMSNDPLIDDEFNETLQSEHINDQLEDPNLQREAESEYDTADHRGLGEKIKNKFHDLTGN